MEKKLFDEKLAKCKAKLAKALADICSALKTDQAKEAFKRSCYVAGGAIWSTFNEEDPNDYDIFCRNKDDLQIIIKDLGDPDYATDNADTYTMTIQKHTGQNASGNVLPYEDSACIAFCGKTNSQVYIAVSSDKHLLIHYRPVTDRVQNWEAVDWTFDDAVYRNFIIDSLSFDVVSVNGRKTNIIRVSLQITDPASGFSMNAERYVECYNFSAAEVNKIIKEEILTDSAA